jgi:hypothetical protein
MMDTTLQGTSIAASRALARSIGARGRARVLMVALGSFTALALFACGERPPQSQPSEAAKVVGVPPAPPRPDPPTVKPAPGTTEIAKEVEIAAMPLPGQADDPETLALLNSQRSEAIDVLKDPELAKIANSDAALEKWREKKLRQAQLDQWQRSRHAQAERPASR